MLLGPTHAAREQLRFPNCRERPQHPTTFTPDCKLCGVIGVEGWQLATIPQGRVVSNTAKSIAIAVAILGGNTIAILSAILYFKSVLQYYCDTFCNTPSRACAHIQHGTDSHCQLYYYKWKPRCTHIIVPALTQH